MPLDKSGSKESVGKNIDAEMSAGKPYRVALAIALSTKDRVNALKSKPKRKRSAR